MLSGLPERFGGDHGEANIPLQGRVVSWDGCSGRVAGRGSSLSRIGPRTEPGRFKQWHDIWTGRPGSRQEEFRSPRATNVAANQSAAPDRGRGGRISMATELGR